MIDLRCLDLDEMYAVVSEYGWQNYRAVQLFEWINRLHARDFYDMRNVPQKLIEKLSEKYFVSPVNIVKKLQSSIDNTIKYLFEPEKGVIIESVRMKQDYGNTVCVSTQAGCNMGCAFCASSIGGKLRDLTIGEMAAQIYAIEADIGERVSNVVLMGCGEPLDNYNNSVKLIKLLNHQKGANISQRNMTLSTCGMIDGINRLAKENLQITLAVSLHAPNNEIRRKIMPIANRYSFVPLIDACRSYVSATKRRITFEYALIKGLNDSPDCAVMLAENIRGIMCHVNLIPINEIDDCTFQKSNNSDILSFAAIIEKNDISVTIRKEKGADISAACGQLRNRAGV